MTDVPEIPRPSQLWKTLSAERKVQAAEGFWRDENASAEQAEAVATIAQRIKFRTKSVVAMPVEKKARHLATLANISEIVAARLLVVYHFEQQRPMMGAFLDALGIAHENGLIQDENAPAPSDERLAEAAKTLAASFPTEEVALYLSTLIWQDPETWGGLAKVAETRALAPSS